MKKLLIFLFVIFGCAAGQVAPEQIMPRGQYSEWLSTCKDYKDVQNWFIDVKIKYDVDRLNERLSKPMPVNAPWITFEKRSGVCSDIAVFTKYSLNKINPEYKAEILFLDEPGKYDHFVCVFHVDDKLYIMDYGTMKMQGVFGPFNELSDFITFYRDAKGKKVEKYYYGWPASRRGRESW